jgi:predicted Zn-dependent peptidase
MQGLGKSLLLFNQIDSIQEIYAGIDKLSVQDLKDISHKYFDEKNISELVFEVGDD